MSVLCFRPIFLEAWQPLFLDLAIFGRTLAPRFPEPFVPSSVVLGLFFWSAVNYVGALFEGGNTLS